MLKLYPNARLTIAGRTNTVADIIHEIGHALAQKNDDFYNNFLENFKDDYDEEIVSCELSLYAIKNKNEFFAESFADYVINKDKASKFGKAIPKFLKDQGVI